MVPFSSSESLIGGKPMQGCWTKSIKAPVTSANLKLNYSKCVLKVAKALLGDLAAETEF